MAGIRYEMDDRAPYAWRTDDYGTTWTRIGGGPGDGIGSGIPDGAFVRVLREDPKRAGLLYAGTEHGVFVSFDGGSSWGDLSLGLPDTPVTGLSVEERDLVISTHGRSFWVLDDIETLRQLDAEGAAAGDADAHLFRPADAVRRAIPAVIDFRVNSARPARLDVLTDDGEHVRTLLDEEAVPAGTHRARWDLRYPGAVTFPGIVLEGGNPAVGPWAPPGRYLARLTVGDATSEATRSVTQEVSFDVRLDPRLRDVPTTALADQFRLAMAIRDAESQANESVLLARNLLAKLAVITRQADDEALRDAAATLAADIEAVAGELYQLRNQSPKDKIAFPIKLNDRLTGLRTHLERGDGTPLDAYEAVFNELSAKLDAHMQTFRAILRDDLPRLNEKLARAGLPQVGINRPDPEAQR